MHRSAAADEAGLLGDEGQVSLIADSLLAGGDARTGRGTRLYHRERLKGIEGRLGAIETTENAQTERQDRIENGVKGLRRDRILADALRDTRRTA